MPGKFLRGMQSLEKIEIKSAGTLQMDNSVFHQVPKLTHITVASSHVTKMPDLCQSSKLTYVNFTDNDLQSISSSGVVCENKTTLSQLSTLILDRNTIFNVSSGSLKSMPNLMDLRIADGTLLDLEESVLEDVPKLRYLDITNNAISEVPASLFTATRKLKVLGLGRNPLGFVQTGTFSTLENLLLLTLDYSSVNNFVWNSLQPLHQLKDLKLQGNNITELNKTVLDKLVSLRNLDLRNNSISNLFKGVFQSLFQLQFLHLSHNNLSVITNRTFIGLKKLMTLDLHGNKIAKIETSAFTELESLLELDLSDNALIDIPDFQSVEAVLSLDLSSNRIQTLSSNSFKGLKNLEKLNLSRNLLTTIVNGVFIHSQSLGNLDLSFNQIRSIHKESLEGLQSLSELSFRGNYLENISMVPQNLPGLKSLDLSSNMLISKIMNGMFPENIENLDLSDNNISDITDYAFYSYQGLQILSLKGNKLTTLSMNDLAVSIQRSKTLMVYIADNPFNCDCHLIWLRKKVSEVSMNTGFPVVGDMFSLQCQSGYRIDKPVPFYTVEADDMLCTYDEKCTSDCYCCDFDPCDCKFVCPYGCSCYSSSDYRTTHFVQCSKRGFKELPSNFPALTTELSLDGNNISEINSKDFVGLMYLRVIHLNHSGITALANYSFIGLLQLKVLYLNNNEIQNITTGVFTNLWNLTDLHLEYNRISFIEEGAFSSLASISALYLDHNELATLPESTLKLLWILHNSTLAENEWSCDCAFMTDFLPFLTNRSAAIADYSSMYCNDSNQSNKKISIKDVTAKLCPNITTVVVTEVKKLGGVFSNMPTILIIFAAVAIFIVVSTIFIALLICFWKPIRLYIHKKCKCGGSKGGVKEEKLYDAFVAYSHKDDDYVTREFIPRLEKDQRYRLCVYYRDFPIGGTIAEAVTCSISRSKRTILLVSKNFNDHEWKNSAFHNSFQTLFRQKSNNLIVVLLEDTREINLDRNLNILVKSHPAISYRDMCFWEKLQYMMGQSKRSIMRNNTPDIILNHSYSRQDDDGYETPVSSCASQTETDKCSGLERCSLESINNIYEEIRSSKLSDISAL
jgi:Leucine-rich repeat (LRR) protein